MFTSLNPTHRIIHTQGAASRIWMTAFECFLLLIMIRISHVSESSDTRVYRTPESFMADSWLGAEEIPAHGPFDVLYIV